MNEVDLNGLIAELAWRTSGKICPMKMAAGEKGTCEGSNCAWWNPYYGDCCIGSDYRTMDYIGQSIAMLANQLRTQSEGD